MVKRQAQNMRIPHHSLNIENHIIGISMGALLVFLLDNSCMLFNYTPRFIHKIK